MNQRTDTATKIARLAALVICIPLLGGCVGAAVVGAGAGALMIADRRTSEVYIADQGLELRANSRISEKYGDKVHVNATSYNRMMLLTGEVPTAEIKADVEKIATGVTDVKSISNELAIAGPSSFGGAATIPTSPPRSRRVSSMPTSSPPNHVKVVTEAGVVFLLGIVTQAEADAAVEIARTTGGVQKVVRVFEIISPEQAKADNKPAPAPKEAKPADSKAAPRSRQAPHWRVFAAGLRGQDCRSRRPGRRVARAAAAAGVHQRLLRHPASRPCHLSGAGPQPGCRADRRRQFRCSVRRLGKGDDRPVNPLADRMALLAALECVSAGDLVRRGHAAARILDCRPDILVKGGDWPVEKIVGYREVMGWGGSVHSIPFIHQRSTTALMEKIAALRANR
jgi:osmotically-inducible protein OsmY